MIQSLQGAGHTQHAMSQGIRGALAAQGSPPLLLSVIDSLPLLQPAALCKPRWRDQSQQAAGKPAGRSHRQQLKAQVMQGHHLGAVHAVGQLGEDAVHVLPHRPQQDGFVPVLQQRQLQAPMSPASPCAGLMRMMHICACCRAHSRLCTLAVSLSMVLQPAAACSHADQHACWELLHMRAERACDQSCGGNHLNGELKPRPAVQL